MKHIQKHALVAIAILFILGVTYVVSFGLYPRYFDIDWDEEVQLHDGRVIVVHVTRTYERRGRRMSRYDEDNSTVRHNTFTFDAGTASHTTFSTRMPVAFLGEIDGSWYTVISGQGPYGNFLDEMPDHWGRDYTTLEQRLAILSDGKFIPVAWEQAPSELIRMNLLPTLPLSELVALNGHKVTIDQKLKFEESHPTSYRRQISRPLRMTQTQGKRK